jgi:hypothetical protein
MKPSTARFLKVLINQVVVCYYSEPYMDYAGHRYLGYRNSQRYEGLGYARSPESPVYL